MNARPGSDIAKFVIPAAIGLWLVGVLVSQARVPAWLQAAAVVAVIVLIFGLVGFLILRQSGWRDLARRHPAQGARAAAWKTCRTAVMSSVSRDSPHYVRQRMRLHFIVRVDADESALHLSAPPVLDLLLPPISIAWPAIAGMQRFEASGRIAPMREPGSFFNFLYDPGYVGSFVEIEIAEPKRFLQIPAQLVGESRRARAIP